MSKRVFILVHDTARQGAIQAIKDAPEAYVCEITPPKKSRSQEKLYHRIFGEASRTRKFMGVRQSAETWKRLLVDAFARIKAAEGEPLHGHGKIIPNLDGTGFVQLGVQTRHFKKHQAAEFIEYLYAWMANSEVVYE